MAERRAVVIGINSYNPKAGCAALNGAENDAREVFARLKKFGNFEIEREKHLLIGEQATSENIRAAISNLFWKKDLCDIAVLYFSGHGFLDDYGNGYIAPWDHIYDDPFVRGIRMQELRQYFMADNNKTEALLILDCCHSGVTAEKDKGTPADMSGRFYDSLTGKQPEPLGRGKFIFASSGASEKSREMKCAHKIRILDKNADELAFDDLEEHDHGVMTYFLLEGMNGEAAESGEVKIGKLYDYVSSKVNEYRKSKQADFKVFDCVYSSYEQGPASQTTLVRASSMKQLSQLIQKAYDYLQDMTVANDVQVVTPAALFFAIRCTDDAVKLSPADSEARNLIQVINERLQEYRPSLQSWFLDERSNKYQLATYKAAYKPLEQFGALTFEKIQNLDKLKSQALLILIRLALGEPLEESFESSLLKLSGGKTESMDAMRAATPAAGGTGR